MFQCLECGRKFRTIRAAERASFDGCPGCGGVDIDISTSQPPARQQRSKPSAPTPVQTDDGAVYRAGHWSQPIAKPTAGGMTDEQIREAHDAYLRHLGHEDG